MTDRLSADELQQMQAELDDVVSLDLFQSRRLLAAYRALAQEQETMREAMEKLIAKWHSSSNDHESRAKSYAAENDEHNANRQEAYAYAAYLHAGHLLKALAALPPTRETQEKP